MPRPGLLNPEKEIRYPLYRRLGGPQGWSGRVWKISSPLGFDPRTAQFVASYYINWAIPTHNWQVWLIQNQNINKDKNLKNKSNTSHINLLICSTAANIIHLIPLSLSFPFQLLYLNKKIYWQYAETVQFHLVVHQGKGPRTSALCCSNVLADIYIFPSWAATLIGHRPWTLPTQSTYFSSNHFNIHINQIKSPWRWRWHILQKHHNKLLCNVAILHTVVWLTPSAVTLKLAHTQLTFRHRASCILGPAFHYSPENAFYIFNQQIYFIIWYLLDRASLI